MALVIFIGHPYGTLNPASGCYQEINPPERLVDKRFWQRAQERTHTDTSSVLACASDAHVGRPDPVPPPPSPHCASSCSALKSVCPLLYWPSPSKAHASIPLGLLEMLPDGKSSILFVWSRV